MKMTIAETSLIFGLSYLASKNSGIVLEPSSVVMRLVRRASTFQARRVPRSAFPTPIHTEASPKLAPNLPA